MRRLLICLSLLTAYGAVQAQLSGFTTGQALKPIQQTAWHEIVLPENLFQLAEPNLTDLRLFLLGDEDTVAVPYHLAYYAGETTFEEVRAEQIRQKGGDDKSFATYKLEGEPMVNQARLRFQPRDFDLEVGLEMSNNRLRWQPLGSRTRVLGKAGDEINFLQEKVPIPQGSYKFLRFTWTEPGFTMRGARFGLEEKKEGKYRAYRTDWEQKTDAETSETSIILKMEAAYPVTRLTWRTAERMEYFRNAELFKGHSYMRGEEEVIDWENWSDATLSSESTEAWEVPMAYTQYLKIVVRHDGDVPLKFQEWEVLGPIVALQAELDQAAQYMLAYGQPDLQAPSYRGKPGEDTEIIPAFLNDPQVLTASNQVNSLLGESGSSPHEEPGSPAIWLLGALGLVLLVGGFFFLRRKKASQDPLP